MTGRRLGTTTTAGTTMNRDRPHGGSPRRPSAVMPREAGSPSPPPSLQPALTVCMHGMYCIRKTAVHCRKWRETLSTPRTVSAYQHVRQLIVDQVLAEGEPIREADLAARLGVSRTPIREALLRLQAEGYVIPSGGRGLIVAGLSAQDITNVYQVRAMLEGPAAELAATVITRAELGHLEDLYEAMEEARSKGDNRELAKLNSQFHHSVAAASKNNYLEAVLDNIYDVFERFRPTAIAHPGRRDEAATEHGELIAALRARDGAKAREVAERHVHHALEVRQQETAREA